MKLRMLVFIILALAVSACGRLGSRSTEGGNMNCPDFYPKIEGVFWADKGFTVSTDSLHQYWYRIITYSEEEGLVMYVEKMRQGISEGLGGMEVVERNNITHFKGIDDMNGISLHYKIKKWVDAKNVILEIDSQEVQRGSAYLRSLNVETLSVKSMSK